jgi:copper transport protein
MSTRRVLCFAAVAALAAPASALAHGNLIRSDPPSGAVLPAPPSVVRLYFDDAVRPQSGMRAVRNSGGSVLNGRPRVAGGGELIIPLRARLPHGDYTILWRVLSDDGHPINGITTFAVGAGRPPPKPAFAPPSEQRPFQTLARWLFFAGILAAAGSALFRIAMPREAEPPLWLLFASFLLVVAGGSVLAGDASLETRFGRVVAVAIAVAAGGAAIAAVGAFYRPVSPGAWVAALLLLPAPSIAGHALDPGRPRLELPVDVLHVAASSLWLGGLLSLAVGLRGGRSGAPAVRRFSTLALGSVVVLGATGLTRAYAELGSVSDVWSTGYGRLLIAKTAILGLLVPLGWANRYRVVPALARSAPTLLRNVRAELLLFVGLIVAVALLTQSRPAAHRIANPAAGAGEAEEPSTATVPGALVLGQVGNNLEIGDRVASAVPRGSRYILWETLPSEDGGSTALVERDLRARRTRILARDIASQYALASTGRWVVYVVGATPPRLMALRSDGRRLLLASRLLTAFASRGERVAWAEQDGERQRVVVREMTTGKEWVAADLPTCDRGRCYRIDAVTLADRGVAFARGAIGPQPSFVVRRAFRAPGAEVARLVNDPQPDLVPSSAGAVYYALGRGWYRWDFGQKQPRRSSLAASAQAVRYEDGRWFLLEHRPCGDTLLAEQRGRRRIVVATAASVRRLVGITKKLCVTFGGLSWIEDRPLTTWTVAPPDAHSDEGLTSVVLVGARLR